VPTDGIEAVEAACAEALSAGIASADVVLNALSRHQQPASPENIVTTAVPTVNEVPLADCSRYDRLLS